MKKTLCLSVLIMLVSVISSYAADSYKLLFKDYSIYSNYERPLAVGVCSWTSEDDPLAAGGYFDLAFISLFDDYFRLGAGMIVAPNTSDKLRLETSITTRFDWLEIGVYYCPFWGLTRYSDPYGVMIGYCIKFE